MQRTPSQLQSREPVSLPVSAQQQQQQQQVRPELPKPSIILSTEALAKYQPSDGTQLKVELVEQGKAVKIHSQPRVVQVPVTMAMSPPASSPNVSQSAPPTSSGISSASSSSSSSLLLLLPCRQVPLPSPPLPLPHTHSRTLLTLEHLLVNTHSECEICTCMTVLCMITCLRYNYMYRLYLYILQ